MKKRFCRLWESEGKFYLSDKYDLNRTRFDSFEERQKWMDNYVAKLGEELVALPLGPIEDRSIDSLTKDMIELDRLTLDKRASERR